MKTELIIVLLLGAPGAVFGYTDPGTGIFLYQALIATVVGLGWSARRFVGRLFSREGAKPGAAQE